MASVPNATVTVGAQQDFTRLAFRFAGPTTVTPLLQGNRLDLRFSRAADIDIAELRATPPRLVREVRRVSAAGAPVRLQLTLQPGVRQRHFVDGDRVVVDLLPPEGATEESLAAAAENPAPAPALRPVNGTGRVQLVENADDTRITVTWPAPARAAAFRRGEAIWLVFDAAGRIDLSGVARVGRRHQDVQMVQGQGIIGIRVPAPPDIQVSARADDNAWTFTLAARATAPAAAQLTRQVAADGRGSMSVRFGREGVVRWINDPEIGDRIAVAMLGGPARGVDTRRATLEAAILPAAHGAVVEPRADDVTATYADGALTVTRGQGLITAAPAAQSDLEAGLNAAMMEEALGGSPMHEAAPASNLVQVRERIDQLTRAAAEEGVREGAPVEARMALARYLLENEFAAEALGALRIVAINQGELVEIDPEYRLLRGAANVMMGRVHAAQPDLTASALMNNPSAALWRGYAAAQQQNWADARRELERGAGGLEEHPPAWRARFQLALAQAAIELNDYAAAEAAARAVVAEAPDQTLRLQGRLIEARIVNARGDPTRALTMLDELARTHDEETVVRAQVEAIRIRRATGAMRAVDAIEPLEALRFRWRGNSTELAIVGMLGETYSELGRWREALATMRIAADRFPTDPAARQLRADMSTLFERLFLDGEADQLEPIQALGLFYEFSDLTPVGPNGDRIVRLLAGRLVHVDLLEQAAQLLQHQVDERLQGVSKAQVAADLAAIYLMDHKPDRALTALASSRQPNIPQTLQADRRILEARSLLDLGRLDGAAELVERDRSEDAQRVRAEAAWRARDWQRAAVELRALLNMRNRSQPLDAHGRQAVLRTSVALTLAGDEAGVRALYRDYAGDMANTEESDAFEIVAAGVQADGAAIRDVARAVARTDLLDRFLQRQRARMTEQAAQAQAQASTTQTPAPAAPQSPAAPPPQAALPAPSNRTQPEAGA
jgi:tetratricopeptide (TPR) repeat protein